MFTLSVVCDDPERIRAHYPADEIVHFDRGASLRFACTPKVRRSVLCCINARVSIMFGTCEDEYRNLRQTTKVAAVKFQGFCQEAKLCLASGASAGFYSHKHVLILMRLVLSSEEKSCSFFEVQWPMELASSAVIKLKTAWEARDIWVPASSMLPAQPQHNQAFTATPMMGQLHSSQMGSRAHCSHRSVAALEDQPHRSMCGAPQQAQLRLVTAPGAQGPS